MKNVHAGTGTIIIAGKGLYTGKVKKTFKILPFDLTDKDAITAVINGTPVKNEKTRKYEIAVEVRNNGKLLVKGVDYTICYKNNGKPAVATSIKAPTVIIKGKGNYKKKYSDSV